jgi:lipopolysaccharide/colanic/teichoic acid biosynthesis glycosyltransferase
MTIHLGTVGGDEESLRSWSERHLVPEEPEEHSGGRSVIGLRRFVPSPKRILDFTTSLALLVGFAPLLCLLALGVALDSRGPVFYRCRRVGRYGREFAMLKFRKMHDGASGPALTSARDERFTRFGAVLARTKLDELPQLWNVLRGDMSLVGPRPEDPSFVAFDPAGFSQVLRVRPGVTGLSQLAFAQEGRLLGGADRLDLYVRHLLPQKISIDRLYATRRSMKMDLRILAWTLPTVLLGVDVAVNRRSGALSVRRRAEPFVTSSIALGKEGR